MPTMDLREYLAESRLRKSTLQVVDAFADQLPLDDSGGILSTDGKKLHQSGMGGQQLAVWRGRTVFWTGDGGTRFQGQIMRRLTKSTPQGTVEIRGLKIKTGGDSMGDQWEGWIHAYLPSGERVGVLSWRQWQKEYDILFVEVEPEFRRTGIATALYQRLFKDQGITVRDLKSAMKTGVGGAFRKGARL